MDIFLGLLAALGIWTTVSLLLCAVWYQVRRRVVFAREVLVNLTDGSGIRGTLVKFNATTMVLVRASLVGETTTPISLDGTVYLERRNIHFVQGL
ncbi:hypothetical protein [Nocardia phage NBR1]|uniref:hypothetical protein n=1 Tax=Nocardia phage NBR1 TaxID=1109711 RepID=UPI00023EED96|nr:hypothetical protein [Nocardia phage NBR1]AEV52217.1 hypothetical protein [Nocardia phage NBR1]